MEEAVDRRLYQELRISSELSYLYKFQYAASYGEAGSERELCWVYAGISDDPVMPNATEIADWCFVSPERLDQQLRNKPEQFTPWFKLEWPRVRSMVNSDGFASKWGGHDTLRQPSTCL